MISLCRKLKDVYASSGGRSRPQKFAIFRLCSRISVWKIIYLFLLNKPPLLEKSNSKLKRRGLLTRDFWILKIWIFAQELTKKGPKIFPRLRRGFFLKKGGFTKTGGCIEQEKVKDSSTWICFFKLYSKKNLKKWFDILQ